MTEASDEKSGEQQRHITMAENQGFHYQRQISYLPFFHTPIQVLQLNLGMNWQCIIRTYHMY
jgi:hypothetical protein